MEIKNIVARQILDSRGNPTVEADVWIANGVFGRAAVPSGASTGIHEAHELRDGGSAYYGMSVYEAINNIHDIIKPALLDIRVDDQFLIDQRMIDLDGTKSKSKLGANAILAVSLACAHAAAKARGILLYSHIADIAHNSDKSLPMPMMNVLNGGKHANGSTDIQETMIIPKRAKSFAEAIQIGAEVFHELKSVLSERGESTAVGDEGGFTLHVKQGNTEALDVLSQAIRNAGYSVGEDVVFALDVASSELYSEPKYSFPCDNTERDSTEMNLWYQGLVKQYPIVSIEDGMAQDDWDGWQDLTKSLPSIQLVGDDLLVTNSERLQRAINLDAANAILIKPNQVGTLTETIRAIQLAKNNGWNTIISHRSGETEDVSIAHIAIGTGAGQIKTGSLSRSERTAKHNELMRIESIDPTLRLINPFS
jgi:enolase